MGLTYTRSGYPQIREHYLSAMLTPGLWENRDTTRKRVDHSAKDYTLGQCDLAINNYRELYRGMCIEFKSPSSRG